MATATLTRSPLPRSTEPKGITIVASMMNEAAWEHIDRLAREEGLTDAERFGLSVGCPKHGNASMDFEGHEVFCHACIPLRPWVPVNG